jgi:excisionase family DNA binding protein
MGNTLFNTKEAAKYLRITARTLRDWYQKGKIQGSKPGGKNLLFTQEQLDAVLNKPKRFRLFR